MFPNQEFVLRVNGAEHRVEVDEATPLLYVLRGQLGLFAAKFGCGLGQCGACKVILDGKAVSSCDLPVGELVGKTIETLESIGSAGKPHALQLAFLEENAGQCGYCIAGILVAAKALLDANPNPSEEDIRQGLSGNLCRCGSHPRYIRAVQRAAERLSQSAAAVVDRVDV